MTDDVLGVWIKNGGEGVDQRVGENEGIDEGRFHMDRRLNERTRSPVPSLMVEGVPNGRSQGFRDGDWCQTTLARSHAVFEACYVA